MGAQKRAYAMTISKYSKVLDLSYNPPLWIRLNSVILTAISSFSTLFILIYAAVSGVSNAEYIAFTASFGILSSTLDSLVGVTRTITRLKPNLEQLDQLFAFSSTQTEGNRYVRSLQGNIDIEDLSFSYSKDIPPCLNHLSLHIRRGEKVAIVGESGCGKSTLLKLMIGLIQPTSGSIAYDGLPLSSFNLRSFRKRVGSVFQFSRVFPGTIMENICFCAPESTEEEAWEAAEKAAIAEEIRALPSGMSTEITEDANGGFSGGQLQRLILARVFAQKPSLVILDEATSALDNRSQHHVLSSVYNLPCTVIMVAHRLSTVKNCNRIIVLKSGKIAEEGDYDTLMSRRGVFYELVKKQQ
ncbi:MAG: ATP-binding cassette domain-containing protein [Parasporobacterium sp.]|nr:ATP-binding cassette domain-containing protein [Parasporobacterium sp.]